MLQFPKGQSISKCLFGFFKSTKKQRKCLKDFCPKYLSFKKRPNQKTYAVYSTKYSLISGISRPDKLDIRVQIDWARMSHILWYLSECRFKRVGQFCVSSAKFHRNQLFMALTAQNPT